MRLWLPSPNITPQVSHILLCLQVREVTLLPFQHPHPLPTQHTLLPRPTILQGWPGFRCSSCPDAQTPSGPLPDLLWQQIGPYTCLGYAGAGGGGMWPQPLQSHYVLTDATRGTGGLGRGRGGACSSWVGGGRLDPFLLVKVLVPPGKSPHSKPCLIWPLPAPPAPPYLSLTVGLPCADITLNSYKMDFI